jgi:hypothetical protein
MGMRPARALGRLITRRHPVVTLRILFALTIAFSLLALGGCDDNNSELERSAISVSAVDNGGVYVCATWNAGQNKTIPDPPDEFDDYQPFAHLPVRVKNRPYNEFITNPDYSPYGDFRITKVKVEWVAIASGDPARLAELQAYNFESGYDVSVPSGSEVDFNVLLLPFYAKSEAPLINLANVYGGDGSVPGFVAVAEMTFTGHDSGSTREVDVVSQTMVEFIGIEIDVNN